MNQHLNDLSAIQIRSHHKQAGKSPQIFVFPVPVVENEKYLIRFECPNFAGFFIEAQELGRLKIFTQEIHFEALHQDGRTPILTLPPSSWEWIVFLNPGEHGEKAKRIQDLINHKLKDFLYCVADQKDDKQEALEKTWRAQKNCRVCQSMGILDPANQQVFDSIMT